MPDAVPAERLPEREALLAELEVGGYLTDPLLEEAMLSVPRHLFVPDDLRDVAYEDRPLPIGFGQTVSAPHMVAMMTSALQVRPGDKVLEVGAGVGYHAAIVKRIVGPKGRVISVEYLPELVELARRNLKKAKIDVEVHEGDGFEGHPDEAPYDAVYVTCAIPQIPDALAQQLKEGGHFVAPLGITRCQLVAGHKKDGVLQLDDLGPCLFVNAQGRLGVHLDIGTPVEPLEDDEGLEDDESEEPAFDNTGVDDDLDDFEDEDFDDDDDDEGGMTTTAP